MELQQGTPNITLEALIFPGRESHADSSFALFGEGREFLSVPS